MENLGLYAINDSKTVEGVAPIEGQTNTWKRTTLLYNGQKVATTSAETDGCGLRVDGDELILNGESIAKGNNNNWIEDSNGIKFGDADLLGYNKCINITKNNYNALLQGITVEGYKSFDPGACYNIVEDVANSPLVDRPELTDLHDPLYNNLYDPLRGTPGHTNDPYDLPDNSLNNSQTYLDTAAPHLSTHGYKFEITPGEQLEFTYMVDSRTGDKINRLTIDDTFTTIIKDASGNILFKNTTYAGVFKVTLAPFMDGNNYLEGETWFSIECINKAGVGSVVHFMDIWIHNPIDWYYYCPSDTDLRSYGGYGIYPNTSNQTVAYRNKILLKQLCQEVADGLYKDGNGRPYNALRLPNTGRTIYYLSPYKNFNAAGTDPMHPVLPTRIYRVAHRKGGSTFSQQITPGGNIVIPVLQRNEDGTVQKDEETGEPIYKNTTYHVDANESPLDFIRRDGAKLHVIQPEDLNDGLSDPEYNATAEDVGKKSWVVWKKDALGALNEETEKFTGRLTVLDGYTTSGKPKYKQILAKRNWLRTYSADRSAEYRNFPSDKYFYLMECGVTSSIQPSAGDPLTFPDNFVLDLNGSTIQMTKCVDLWQGNMVSVDHAFNVHIKNGTFSGFFNPLYKETDTELQFDSTIFKDHWFSLGIPYNTPYEHLRTIYTGSSRYCTFENIHIANELGYSGIIDSSLDRAGSICHSGHGSGGNMNINLDTVGYVDLSTGEIKTDADPIETNVSMAPRLSGTADIALVCTSQLIDCSDAVNSNFIQFPNEFLIYLGGTGINSCGKQREIMLSFYDNNETYISSIKTEFNKAFQKPPGAKYMRITGYGFSVNGQVPKYTVSSTKQVCVPFELLYCEFFEFSRCCSYINCTFENTRTIAFYPVGSRNVLYDNCTWKQIANLTRTNFFVTWLWGDVEEGWQIGEGVTIKDGLVTYHPQFYEAMPYYPESYQDLHRHWTNHGCRNLTILNTDGISISFGATQDAYIANSTFSGFSLARKQMFEHPCINVRNCKISYSLSSSINEDKTTLGIENGDQKFGVFRDNFCDDPVVKDVVFQDILAIQDGSFSDEMTHLFRRSKIGDKTYK